jgi:hypothetical protein
MFCSLPLRFELRSANWQIVGFGAGPIRLREELRMPQKEPAQRRSMLAVALAVLLRALSASHNCSAWGFVETIRQT